MKKEKSAGAVIINSNKILIIKHLQGHWSFPKGHLEKNETEIEAAKREIKEEVNLEVKIIPTIKETITYFPEIDIIKDVVFFLAFPLTTKIKLQETEVAEYRWCTYTESLQLLTHESDKQVLQKIYTKYQNL